LEIFAARFNGYHHFKKTKMKNFRKFRARALLDLFC